MRRLHLNRRLGGCQACRATEKECHRGDFRPWEHSANLSLVAFQKHIMQATVFSLLEGCIWPGPVSLLSQKAQDNCSSDNRYVHRTDPSVKADPSTLISSELPGSRQCLSPILHLRKPRLREVPSLGQPAQPGSYTAGIQTQAG